MMAVRAIWCGMLMLLTAMGAATAEGAEPAAILTELRMGQGQVQVKLAAESQWKTPMPLLSLRAGDQVRATGNASAVLLWSGGQGTVTVSTGNSPYTVAPPPAKASQAPALVGTLTGVLMGKKKELAYVPLMTRSVKQPPLLLFPRAGKLLAAPTFEWGGSDRLRYTVRVLGPQGQVWEQADLPRVPLAYPAAAPLQAGTQYRWELEAKGFPVQRGQFALLSPEQLARVRSDLAVLEPARLPGYPKNTVTLMRASYLLDEELYTEARKELQAAIAADPDEPNLHLLLGHVYERTGLSELAAEEFDEAQFLSTR